MNRLARVVFGALALLVAACSDAPVAPQTSGAPQFSAQGADLDKLAQYHNGPPRLVLGLALKVIGPAGGSVSLAGFELIVPPGAVSKLTAFMIRLPLDPSVSNYVWAAFGPHGMTFNTPVTLRLPYRGTTSEGKDSHVVWFDGANWVALPSAFTADGRIETQTTHFSEYGTQEIQPTRGITLSGKPAR